MSDLKTQPTQQSVEEFIQAVSHPTRRSDAQKLLSLFELATGQRPVLWGPSIIGFGSYSYRYPNGKVMTWFPVGFSPRKSAISIYLMRSHHEMQEELDQLGKYKTGKSCIYINKLADVQLESLQKMIQDTYQKLTA